MLHRSPFIAAILRHQPETFPGSSMLVLRLLAFYTSWLRYHFTPVSLCQSDTGSPKPIPSGYSFTQIQIQTITLYYPEP